MTVVSISVTDTRPFRSDEFIMVRNMSLCMSTDGIPVSAVDGESEVMTSIDGDGPDRRVIIADTSTDEVWLAMALEDTMALSDCR